MSFWRATPDGVTLMVKVHPGSRRAGINGTVESAAGPRLKIAVTQAAEGGKANRAVCDLIATALGQPRTAARVLIGSGSREKVLVISGDAMALAGKVQLL